MNKNLKIPELIAPAGSLESAIYAFNAGADAVYFGLSHFSARKYAVNFDEKQYRKLLLYAKNNNKKIYLTLNTIIKEDELKQLIKLLKFLQFFPPNAIIIQDFGIIGLIKYFLKEINIHASTQSGTYSNYSYEIIKNLGIKRVILARESTFYDIYDIKKEFTDIEIEVFIHGALCYSFSGFCLASGILLKRSGNRGECAQICRNYFNFTSKTRYDDLNLSLFSCNDLNLKDNIIKLAKIGVDSFKIEGRMKDPEYTFNTVKNYRNILDRIIEKPEDFLNNLAFNNNLDENKSKNFENNNKNILLSFSRIPTNGYLNNQNGEKLINPFFPFHIGTELGVIKDFNKNFILVKLDEDISQRDGILILVKIKDKIMSFPFSAVKIMVNDREVYKGYKAQVVKISSPSLIEFFNIFNSKYGKQKLDKSLFSNNINLDEFNLSLLIKSDFFILRKISDRNLDLKKINENLLEEEKLKVSIDFKIENFDVEFENKKQSHNSNKTDTNIGLYEINMIYSYNILDKKFDNRLNFMAQKRLGDKSYLKIFEQEISKTQKDDNFEIKVNIDYKLKNIFDKIFIQPSLNKKIVNQIKEDVRKNLYDFLYSESDKSIYDSIIEQVLFQQLFFKQNPFHADFLNNIDNINTDKLNIIEQKNWIFEKLYKNNILVDDIFYRKKISPKNYIEQLDDTNIIPFITFDNLKELDIEKNDTIFKIENILFLPLHPIIDNENTYIELIEKLIVRNKKYIYIFGINSSWHFHFYKKYLNDPNIFFYFDFYIYIANIFSYKYYSNYIKSLFGLFWIEFKDEIKEEIKNNKLASEINKSLSLFEIKEFNPPLFISRGCLERNILNDFVCPKNCKKKYIYKIQNQKNQFLYIIQNCISYLFKSDNFIKIEN